jgi:hypothetical protein
MLRNVKESEKLARYLVEDNYEDHIELNYNRKIKISIMKSVLRKLLTNYTIPTQ